MITGKIFVLDYGVILNEGRKAKFYFELIFVDKLKSTSYKM